MANDKRKIFFVHGRNLVARDAMFAFLRSLDLKPLEWEDAGALTGQATPRTFDSIQKGLSEAQAVVVLLTGDDSVRLRPEYGHERPYFQPRPNVLVEAGLALAALGQERVVLVQLGEIRDISDLAGFNYLKLDNGPKARKALADRLQTAGCALKQTGTDYLSDRSGGDFEAAAALPDDPGTDILRRGGYDSHVVNSAISYTINNIKLLKELEGQLVNPGASDLKYSYLGVAGASNWLTLSEETAYAAHDTRRLINRALPDIFSRQEFAGLDVDFISLGPGDGSLDASIIASIDNVGKVKNYYPFDISVELLQQCIEKTLPICKSHGIKLKAIQGDFLELRKYRPVFSYDDIRNVIFLIGFTFGNYNEGSLLGKIKEAMNIGDYLMIDARLHDMGNNVNIRNLRNSPGNILNGFNNPSNNRFAFGPVEMATTADFGNVSIKQTISANYTIVPNAYNIVTYCENLQTKIKSSKKVISHKSLDLATTTFYDENSLIAFLENRDFRIVEKQTDGNLIAIMLQRI